MDVGFILFGGTNEDNFIDVIDGNRELISRDIINSINGEDGERQENNFIISSYITSSLPTDTIEILKTTTTPLAP